MELTLTHSTPTTMSSRDIAELCEKRHDHVMRDIEKMLSDIGEDGPKFGGIYLDAYGREKPCFHLPKDLTVTLITGYRADLRYKVIKRLEELEARPVSALTGPQLMAAALIEANATMQAQASQIEAMRPTVEAHDRLTKADGSLAMTDVAKSLGMRPKDLIAHLHAKGWIYRRAGAAHWCGRQEKLQQGLLEHKVTTIVLASGDEKITTQVRVTPKGMARLAREV